ncbi:MAG: hypothetical protein ACLTUD_09915 [Bifidobacterium catenulatum]
MAGGKYIIGGRPWHTAINVRDFRPEARHRQAAGLRLLADRLDEYKEEE